MRRKCILLAVYLAYKKSLPRLSRLVVPVEENFPFMLPITIRCDSCSEYIHQGTQLFVHTEEVIDEVPYFSRSFCFLDMPSFEIGWIYMMPRRSAVYLLPCPVFFDFLLFLIEYYKTKNVST